jgi:Mg/Co/Ni transporter MgtE
VIDKSVYKGLVNEYSFYDQQVGSIISDYPLSAEEIFVLPHQHFYDVIKIASDNQLEVVAVVDEKKDYKGVITVKDTLLTAFAQISAIQRHIGSVFKRERLFIGRNQQIDRIK